MDWKKIFFKTKKFKNFVIASFFHFSFWPPSILQSDTRSGSFAMLCLLQYHYNLILCWSKRDAAIFPLSLKNPPLNFCVPSLEMKFTSFPANSQNNILIVKSNARFRNLGSEAALKINIKFRVWHIVFKLRAPKQQVKCSSFRLSSDSSLPRTR